MENKEEHKCGKLTVIKHSDNNWGVIDDEGNVIVPFGKYSWIDEFDQGVTRVRLEKQPNAKEGYRNRWTYIDKQGNSQNSQYEWGVIDDEDNVIVPFGKYYWIHSSHHSLFRAQIMRQSNAKDGYEIKYGIINYRGEIVVPFDYDDLWNLVEKDLFYATVVNDGVESKISFRYLNPELPKKNQETQEHSSDGYDESDNYGTNYGQYAGSYAQDVMGYNDDLINDAFEGDPDAYWNID